MFLKRLKIAFNIVIGILLSPVLILIFLVLLIFPIEKKKTKKWQKPYNSQAEHEKMVQDRAKRFSIPYVEPEDALPDEDFAKRIDEFICLQFWSCNDYSGGITMRELVAADDPKNKACVLAFLQEHPIMELLHGDRDEQACDVNRWKIRFIFDDVRLNRTISGYGCTELTAPYLFEMCRHLPEILSQSEKEERIWQERMLEMQLRKWTTEAQQQNKS